MWPWLRSSYYAFRALHLPKLRNLLPTRSITAPIPENEVEVEAYARDQEAATISGEIVVCHRFKKESTDGVWNREEWEDSYAARTQGQKPVNTFGIPDHGMVVARGCFIPPCPKPPALFIDVEALPEAPRGSDADRVGRGLAPLARLRQRRWFPSRCARPAMKNSACRKLLISLPTRT